MEVKELIHKLHKSTLSALIENQKAYIPLVYELDKDNMPNTLELRHQLKRTNSYRIREIEFIRTNKLSETVFLSSDDLFQNGICKKIICIDELGAYVDSSLINIIADERTLFINCSDHLVSLKYCIVFMQDPVFDTSNLLFSVKDDMFSGSSGDLNISVKGLYKEILTPTTRGYVEPKLSGKYKIFEQNLFVFKNGYFMGNSVTRVVGNVFSINDYTDTDTWEIVLIYNYDDTCIDNINKLEEKINLLDIISQEIPEYITKLQEDFDYRFDMNKSYSENLQDILEYIANYNLDGMLEVFKANNNSIIEEYIGVDILKRATNEFFYISRRRKNKMNSKVIVYVNGELFKYHSDIKYGVTTIGIPVDSILATDEVLIQFFVDCNDNVFTVTFEEGQDNTINYKLLSDDPKNIRLYSPDFEGRHLYDLTVDERRQLEVDYYYTVDSLGNMHIKLDNPYLYGKNLTLVSRRQFKHQTIQIPKQYQGTLNYQVLDISQFLQVFKNNRPNTIKEFDKMFNLKMIKIKLHARDISEMKELSFTNGTKNDSFKYDFPSYLPDRDYAWVLSGYIWIENEDDYTFSILSHNGSKIVIDGEMLVYDIFGQGELNDFARSNNSEDIHLTRGYHSINLYIANHSDINRFALAWKLKTETDFTLIPPELFYSQVPEDYVLPLDTTVFKYCLEHGHYIAFHNGRRLYSHEMYVKMPGIDQVYEQHYLMISKVLPELSNIDIFYVPELVQEVYNGENYPDNGYLTIEKNELLNTFHPDLCGVFVNGKLINPKYITNINNDTIKITKNIHTLGRVAVLKYNMYDGLINTLFEYSNDIWTQVSNTIPHDVLEKYVGEHEHITDDEPDYFKPECPDLIWTIIKNFWIDRFGLIDAEQLFQYNDDPKVLRKSLDKHVTVESSEYSIDQNTSYESWEDDDYNTYYKFECVNPGSIEFGKFEGLDHTKQYSLSVSVSMYLDITGTQERFYCELYDNSGNTQRVPLWYNSEPTLAIKDIPKCYCVRLHLDDIPITETMNNIRLVCITEQAKEYIKFKNGVFLEEGNVALKNIKCIPIDPSIKTYVTLPYGTEFDKE